MAARPRHRPVTRFDLLDSGEERNRCDCHPSTLKLSCEADKRSIRRIIPRLRQAAGASAGKVFGAVNEEDMKKRLELLRVEHRDLDAAIDALTAAGDDAVTLREVVRVKLESLGA